MAKTFFSFSWWSWKGGVNLLPLRRRHGTLEVKPKGCGCAFAQNFATNRCWLFYQICGKPVIRFCRNLKWKSWVPTTNESSMKKKIRNLTNKILGKLRECLSTSYEKPLEILWKHLLNVLYFCYFKLANNAKKKKLLGGVCINCLNLETWFLRRLLMPSRRLKVVGLSKDEQPAWKLLKSLYK